MTNKIAFMMTLKDGTVYRLAENGAVIARTDGPEKFIYSGNWVITGIGKRHHSKMLVSLSDAAGGVDFGQGWVHDWDHGTYRLWANPTGRRVSKIIRVQGD